MLVTPTIYFTFYQLGYKFTQANKQNKGNAGYHKKIKTAENYPIKTRLTKKDSQITQGWYY